MKMIHRLRQMFVAQRRTFLANLPTVERLPEDAAIPLATMSTETFSHVCPNQLPDLSIKSPALSSEALKLLDRWACAPKDFLVLPFDERNHFRTNLPLDFEILAKLDPCIPPRMFDLSCIQYVNEGLPAALDPSELRSKLDLYFVSNTGGCWCIDVAPTRMIRPVEYNAIWDALQCQLSAASRDNVIGKGHGLLIMGHPGIGKSLLLDLLLSWSLHWYPTMPIIVVAVNKTTMFASGRRYDCTCQPLKFFFELRTIVPRGSQILVLHDIKTNQSLHYQCGFVKELKDNYIATVVVASTPQEGNYSDFRKEIPDQICYVLPALTSEESDFYLHTMYPDMSAAARGDMFNNVGGVPRSFTSMGYALQLARMDDAVKSLKFDPVVHNVRKETAQMTNAVVMGIPNLDRSKYHLFDFVSSRARDLWLAAVPAQELACLMQRMRAMQDDSLRDVFARIFEQWVLRKLSDSSHYCYQQLNLGAASGELIRWPHLEKPLSVLRFHELHDLPGQARPMLCLPTSPHFPVVDAILICDKVATLIQVTVARSHRPSVVQMKAILKGLRDQGLTIGSIVWIVDLSSTLGWQQLNSSNSNDPTINEYNAIPQYLCRVSECMFWVRNGAKDAVCFPVAQSDDMSDATTVAMRITEHLKIQPKLPSVLTKGTFEDPVLLNV